MIHHDKVLTGLSEEELIALADGLLAPAAQNRLDALLAKNAAQLLRVRPMWVELGEHPPAP